MNTARINEISAQHTAALWMTYLRDPRLAHGRETLIRRVKDALALAKYWREKQK